MKHLAIATILLMTLSSIQTASAYSPIWNVNGWDAKQLKDAGIEIKTWKHDQIGEDPAMNWVEITYDCSKLAEDQNVLMTLQILADDGEIISATRAEHRKGDPAKLTILFAVGRDNIENSYVEILVPKLLSEPTERRVGDPGFEGYSLRLNRIMELAGKTTADLPIFTE